MSEARDLRLDHLEADVRDIKATLQHLAPMIERIDAQLPHLATKAELERVRAELADKPGKVFLAGAVAVPLAAYAAGLAGLAALPVVAKLVQ